MEMIQEIEESQEVRAVRCSVCFGWLISAETSRNDDFYRDVLKCVNCSRLHHIVNGQLRQYTGREHCGEKNSIN